LIFNIIAASFGNFEKKRGGKSTYQSREEDGRLTDSSREALKNCKDFHHKNFCF